jgi:hypothetical protein
VGVLWLSANRLLSHDCVCAQTRKNKAYWNLKRNCKMWHKFDSVTNSKLCRKQIWKTQNQWCHILILISTFLSAGNQSVKSFSWIYWTLAFCQIGLQRYYQYLNFLYLTDFSWRRVVLLFMFYSALFLAVSPCQIFPGKPSNIAISTYSFIHKGQCYAALNITWQLPQDGTSVCLLLIWMTVFG